MRSTQPYISVVIPTYNRAAYIAEAIDSVLKQKANKWPTEVIVVDDGSTDDTDKVLAAYRNRVHYFKIQHSGLPAVARNFGISQARGKLIAFQDSDDVWPEDKLARQTPLFDDPAVVMSYGQAETMDAAGKLQHQIKVEDKKLKQGEDFKSLLKENVISTLTVMARKDALTKLGAFNEQKDLKAIEDYELWLRIAGNFPGGIKALNYTLAYYRVHPQNISSADALLAIERLLNVFNCLWNCNFLSEANRLALEYRLAIMHENWSRQQNIEGNTPEISVVMGIYKDKEYVAQAVQSILDQTFKDFEFIIIDDGSQDGSYGEVAKFKDPRIRIIRQTNHGLVSVLNAGVRLARADIIGRQDADDISLPKRFAKEIALMKQNDRLGVVGTFFKYVDAKTLKPTGITIISMTKHIDIVRSMYFDNPIGHGTVLIRKKAIKNVGGYTNKYGPNEDYDLWRRLVNNKWEVTIVPEVYYLYRISPHSISRSNAALQHRLFAKLLKEAWKGPVYGKPYREIMDDAEYYRNLKSALRIKIEGQYKNQQVILTGKFLQHGHLREGYKNLVAAFRLYPMGALTLWKTLLLASLKHMREAR